MRLTLCLTTLCLAICSEASACSVPVFRYALERWKPSPFTVYVLHEGKLSPQQQALVAKLDDSIANLRVSPVDVRDTEGDPTAQRLWKAQRETATLPLVVARFPDSKDDTPSAWSGPLTEQTLAVLLDSPGRQRLTKELARGHSAVWVLLTSGDTAADEAATTLLRRELALLEKCLELPEQAKEEASLLTNLPLAVSFAVVTIDRTKPDEAAFVNMLINSDDDLDKVKGPIAFPVFGRGRVLFGLEGNSLKAKEIAGAAKFLCGACSCQVKELNPGVDLLTSADWDALLDSDRRAEVLLKKDPTKGPGEPTLTVPTPPSIPTGLPVAKEEPARVERCFVVCPLCLYGGAGLAGVALVAVAWVMLGRRTA